MIALSGRYFGGPVRIKIQFDTTGESVYIYYVKKIISPPIQLILFGGCSPPKTHTSIAAFEASQFPQLRGLFISISLLKRLKNSFFLSRNPPRGIDFRFHHRGPQVRGTFTCCFWPHHFDTCSGLCPQPTQSVAHSCS